jgi:hypothetical protein
VSFAAPTDAAVKPGRATVNAPGPPGSIEKGAEQQRGYVLTATAPAAETVHFEVTLEVLAAGDEKR